MSALCGRSLLELEHGDFGWATLVLLFCGCEEMLWVERAASVQPQLLRVDLVRWKAPGLFRWEGSEYYVLRTLSAVGVLHYHKVFAGIRVAAWADPRPQLVSAHRHLKIPHCVSQTFQVWKKRKQLGSRLVLLVAAAGTEQMNVVLVVKIVTCNIGPPRAVDALAATIHLDHTLLLHPAYSSLMARVTAAAVGHCRSSNVGRDD